MISSIRAYRASSSKLQMSRRLSFRTMTISCSTNSVKLLALLLTSWKRGWSSSMLARVLS